MAYRGKHTPLAIERILRLRAAEAPAKLVPMVKLNELSADQKRQLFIGMNQCEKGRRTLQAYRKLNDTIMKAFPTSTFEQTQTVFNHYMKLGEDK